MARCPPDLGRDVLTEGAQGLDRAREQQGLADRGDLRPEPLLGGLLPEGGEVGRDRHTGDDLGVGALELGDLGGEVVGLVLVAARVDDLVAGLLEGGGEALLGVAPGVAVAVVGPQGPDDLVVRDVAPEVGEHLDDVLQPPEEVVGPLERLLGVALAAEEVRLPGGDAGDGGHAVGLGLVGHRVGRLRGAGGQNQVDLGAGDEVAGHGRGPVGVRLAVLDQDLDRMGGAADLQAVLECRADAVQDEGVGLAEAGQGPRLGADVAELDGPALGAAAGPAALLLVVLAGGQQGRERQGGPGQAQEAAPVEPARPEQVVERGMHRLVGHGYLLVGTPADGHGAAVAAPGGRPAWAAPSRARSSPTPALRGRPVSWPAHSSAARSRSVPARPRAARLVGAPIRRARSKQPAAAAPAPRAAATRAISRGTAGVTNRTVWGSRTAFIPPWSSPKAPPRTWQIWWWIPVPATARAAPASQAPRSVCVRPSRSSGRSTACGSPAARSRIPSTARAVEIGLAPGP